MRFRSGQRSEALKRAWQGLNYRLQGVSLRQMLMKLSVPAQANISDCVDKGVLSLTAAGVQLVAQHRASAMGMWQAFAQPPAAAEAGPIVECWPAAATAAPAAP